VVTFALDALLAQGETISQVVVLHLSPENARVQLALTQLSREFTDDFYTRGGLPCRFRHIVVHDGPQPLLDIQNAADAAATWRVVHELISTLKSQDWRLHLCLAGGRRMMGLLAMSAAMLLFGHYDRLWHMYTPDEFLARAHDGAIMHARPEDGVRLIQVPVAPWGAYFPALRALAQTTPEQAIAVQTRWLDQAERARCRAVVQRLTPRQLDVLRAFATGQRPQQVAETLSVTVKTVHAHKTIILSECRNAWDVPDETRLDYYFLREKFGRYFQTLGV